MYDGNPGEIDFGSSQREVRVSEGSSYRESTVVAFTFFSQLQKAAINVLKISATHLRKIDMEHGRRIETTVKAAEAIWSPWKLKKSGGLSIKRFKTATSQSPKNGMLV